MADRLSPPAADASSGGNEKETERERAADGSNGVRKPQAPAALQELPKSAGWGRASPAAAAEQVLRAAPGPAEAARPKQADNGKKLPQAKARSEGKRPSASAPPQTAKDARQVEGGLMNSDCAGPDAGAPAVGRPGVPAPDSGAGDRKANVWKTGGSSKLKTLVAPANASAANPPSRAPNPRPAAAPEKEETAAAPGQASAAPPVPAEKEPSNVKALAKRNARVL